MSDADNEVTHGEMLAEIRAMRSDLAPLVEMQPELRDLVEVMKALKVGGKGVRWMASLATALLTLGGLALAIKAAWHAFWNGG